MRFPHLKPKLNGVEPNAECAGVPAALGKCYEKVGGRAEQGHRPHGVKSYEEGEAPTVTGVVRVGTSDPGAPPTKLGLAS